MISAASVHSFAERKTKNLFSMRPPWLKKDSTAETATNAASSPDSPKIRELTSSAHGKFKTLSRPRIRELLTMAMTRLMERMIAELFPCSEEENAGFSGSNAGAATAAGEGSSSTPLPGFQEFLKHICRRTRTPLTCMCLALLYLTRLRANHPRSRGSPGSSYRLALSSLCVATKYLYDDAYHTCSWVQVSMGLFSQREVNQMEMEFMYFLHYQLGVTPTEWNQWIATLEAKLVANWEKRGKAEIIYGFGLFLSYECCEPSAQEAVRDIAWGEGGKSLLSLLNSAIHSSGNPDEAKGSPSADSAVSDSTCLPTPDPNSWFRIQSPSLSASGEISGMSTSNPMSAAVATSSSITPTSARMPELGSAAVNGVAAVSTSVSASNFSEEYGSLSNTQKTLRDSSYLHNPYAERIQTSPDLQKYPCTTTKTVGSMQQHVYPTGSVVPSHSFSTHARPSSVCSVPAMSSSSGGYHESGARYGTAMSVAHSTHRHVSESKTHDWGHAHHKQGYPENGSPCQKNAFQARDGSLPQQQRLSHLGSESSMCFNIHSARHVSSTASPFNSLSGNTATMSLSYSGDTRDESGFDVPDRSFMNDRRLGASTSGGLTHMQAQYGAGPRSSAYGGFGIRNVSSHPQLDSRTGYSSQSSLSKHQTFVVSSNDGSTIPHTHASGMYALNDCSSSTAAATVACRDYRNGGAPPVSEFSSIRNVPRPTGRRPTTGGVSMISSSSRTASPNAEQRGAGAKPPGGASVPASSCAPSAKSSASSLKANGRRHSWRHSAKNSSGSSFAQKLRSFAVFSWASGSGNSGANNNNNNSSGNGQWHGHSIRGSPAMKDRSGDISEDTAAPYHEYKGDRNSMYQQPSLAMQPASNIDRAYGSKRSSCIPLQNSATAVHGTVSQTIGFARQPADLVDQQIPYANAKLQSLAAERSCDFELDMSVQ
ncbi:hypothetical protein FB645_004807 [Coemansia sp. IMI 203386]|nr:hypothetical protein FB645_004807 [Coemansia sp. IMI 203386]